MLGPVPLDPGKTCREARDPSQEIAMHDETAWRQNGVGVARAGERDLNTPQTPGMT